MKFSRRRLGRIILGMSVVGTPGWHGVACAYGTLASTDGSLYPTLVRLASLYPEAAAWSRLASTLSPSAVARLAASGLARAERNAACACAKRQCAGREILSELLASDFRRGRTVQAGAFLVAETEAALLLLRASAKPTA
jgi:hypothetical protein